MIDTCRCGFTNDGKSPHPCHGKLYTCRKPALARLYNVQPVCLAGMQPKLGASQTWACDECWEEFMARVEAQRQAV